MVKDKISALSDVDKSSGNVMSDKGDANPNSRSTKLPDRFQKELVSRLLKKSECIKQSQRQARDLLEKKNVLASTVKTKDEEIYKLNDKILLLTRELATLKADHLQALKEIKMLKAKVHESERNNELMNQKKKLFDQVKTELMRSDELLVQEKLKTRHLEGIKLNPHKWRTMAYTDPRYYEILQRKNRLQKELQKKLNLLETKEEQLEQKEALMKKLRDMLKRRPFNLVEKPEQQMMQYYRTIQVQKETIKSLTAQVNMFESLISDGYNRQCNN